MTASTGTTSVWTRKLQIAQKQAQVFTDDPAWVRSRPFAVGVRWRRPAYVPVAVTSRPSRTSQPQKAAVAISGAATASAIPPASNGSTDAGWRQNHAGRAKWAARLWRWGLLRVAEQAVK